MNIEQFRNYCLELKGVTESFPFNDDVLVFKVGGKIFALTRLTTWEKGIPVINLKCNPEKSIELRELYEAIQPGFHMNKKHWNSLYLEENQIPKKLIKELVNHSYELVFQSLSKKIKMKLIPKPNYLTNENLYHFIKEALREDIQDGDHSTLASVPKKAIKKARLLIKEDCVLAGVEMAKIIFHYYDKNLKIELLKNDGDIVKKGEVAFYVEGNAQSILTTERLVLNCMQRMSGIATHTKVLNDLIKHTDAKLLDTRKTTPNFRICEKWAVHIAGGTNHRYGLYDMVMLKDNHIDYCGSITKAVAQTKTYLKKIGKELKIEVETRNLDEVQQALDAKVDRIMLDNFSVKNLKKGVGLISKKAEVEASGGITKESIKAIAETGVDFISVGALTHSSVNIDLSLKAMPLK